MLTSARKQSASQAHKRACRQPHSRHQPTSAAQVSALAAAVMASLPVSQAAQEQMHASCASANCVPTRQLSVGLLRTPSSSWIMKRVTATLGPKQQSVSSARHASGALRSPTRPLHG